MNTSDEIRYALLAHKAEHFSLDEALDRIHRAVAEVTPDPPAKPAPAKKAKPVASSKNGKPRPTKDAVLAYAREHNAGFKKVASHFQSQGYHLPEGTARGWLNNQQ